MVCAGEEGVRKTPSICCVDTSLGSPGEADFLGGGCFGGFIGSGGLAKLLVGEEWGDGDA